MKHAADNVRTRAGPPQADVASNCRPGESGNCLTLLYRVENRAPDDVCRTMSMSWTPCQDSMPRPARRASLPAGVRTPGAASLR